MEGRFGLTPEQLEDSFFAMEKAKGEGVPEYVIRIEDARVKLGIEERITFRSFLPRLPSEFRRKLDEFRALAATMGGSPSLEWC